LEVIQRDALNVIAENKYETLHERNITSA